MRFVRPCRIRFARALPAGVGAAATALLLGCSGNNFAPPGTPVLTMGRTTNSSDFAAYIISVDLITLTATDGSQAAPITTPEVVDFAQLNSLTELVETPAVPSGTYTSATITLDYSAPSIWLNLNGSPVSANVVNNTGAAITTETVTVTFDPHHPLVVTAGQSVQFRIDFDLNASHSVTSTSPATVEVQPFVTMSVASVDSTVMRARGLFVVVPTGSQVPAGTHNAFIMNMRPFYDLVSALGALNVNTDANTYWNINGTIYTGTAGLAALGGQQEQVPVVAYGTLDDLSGITPSFNATSVYVGTSQESELYEYLTGVVSARSGDTLTLRGITYLQPLGSPARCYVSSAPVTIGSGTVVSQDGVATPGLTPASISVGQQITVYGQANPAADVDVGLCTLSSLDATAGHVRLAQTPVWGTPTAVGPGSATLDVLSLGAFAPSGFNFTGTGANGQDAAPTAYAVNTGSLDTSAITAGTLPALATGIVTPFGSAPPDFTASAITPGANTLQTLVVEWNKPGAAAPFTSITSAGLVVNLADANLSAIHRIRTGPATTDLNTLPSSPLITTVGAGETDLVLAVGSSSLANGISVFNSASAFTAGLNSALAANKVFRLVAYGQYNSSSNTFVASRINVALEE